MIAVTVNNTLPGQQNRILVYSMPRFDPSLLPTLEPKEILNEGSTSLLFGEMTMMRMISGWDHYMILGLDLDGVWLLGV